MQFSDSYHALKTRFQSHYQSFLHSKRSQPTGYRGVWVKNCWHCNALIDSSRDKLQHPPPGVKVPPTHPELQKVFKLAQALFSPKSEQKVIQFQICRQVQLGGHYSCLATSQQRNVTKMGRCEAAAKI